MTPLLLAIQKSFDEIALYLIDHKATVTSDVFHSSFRKSSLPLIKKLYDLLPANQNIVNLPYGKSQHTPLHRATISGSLPTVKYLLEDLHADPAILNIDSESCLHSAVRSSKPELLSYMLTNNKVVSLL